MKRLRPGHRGIVTHCLLVSLAWSSSGCNSGSAVTPDVVDALADVSTDVPSETVADARAEEVSSSCDAGLAQCTGTCVDLQTDFFNCGACGMACGTANDTCAGGICSCSTGTVCGATCVDLQTDIHNCGACAINCQRMGTGDRCRGGTCCFSPC